MTGCPDEEKLLGFVERTLPAQVVADVRAHVERCEDCRGTVAVLIRAHRPSRDEVTARHIAILGSAPPTRIGRFNILGLLGRGGMGEVYRARDSQLGRDVAIKVLPSALRRDPAWVTRFEREAKTIGLVSHPNILAVYDVGVHDGASYVVTELLDGSTLRARLGEPIELTRAVEIAAEIAAGLAAAHDKGIVHRDIKPENVFLTKDGRVKILDFGLAKYEPSPSLNAVDAVLPTEPGAILGTVGYMPPEQVRGKAVDARSDIFSLGVVLYEMLARRPPFGTGNEAEIMTAVLRDPPLSLPTTVPWAVTRLVLRCLEKDPLDRFQSARDLCADLREAVATRESSRHPPPPARRPPRWPLAVAGVCVAAAAAGALVYARGAARAPVEGAIDYTRLTFRRGVIDNARYAPDRRTVVYSGSFGGEASRVYATGPSGREARALTEPGYSLAAVGRDGELAVLRGTTLARMSLTGAAPRDVAEGVTDADFTPSGDLVVARGSSIEAPLGHAIYTSKGLVRSLRVSPGGDRVAFVEHPIVGDDAGRVCTATLAGASHCLTDAHWYIMNTVTWAPGGGELWFSAIDEGSRGGIYSVEPGAAPRRRLATHLSTSIFEVGPSGALVAFNDLGMSAMYRSADGDTRDLSWLDISMITALTADGSTILFAEGGMGGTSDYEAYLRPTDGGPAVDVGSGFPAGLSDDKQWAILFQRKDDRHRLMLTPTGAGAPRELPAGPVQRYVQGNAGFLPGGATIVFTGRATGDWRVWAQDVAGGDPVPLTEEGWRLARPAVTPDGRSILIHHLGHYALHPIAGGPERPLPELGERLLPLRFVPDGSALYVLAVEDGFRGRVYRLELETGAKTLLYDVRFAGRLASVGPFSTADGRGLAYSMALRESSLFLVSGLRP